MPGLFDQDTAVGLAQVAVERAIDRHPDGLSYLIPPTLADLVPGDRVLVPLGRGDSETPGVVVEVGSMADADPSIPLARLKWIAARDRGATTLPRELLALARWVSSYYICPVGITVAGILPAAVREHTGAVTRKLIDLIDADEPSPATREPIDPGAATKPPRKLSAMQRAALEHLRELAPAARPIEIKRLAKAIGAATVGPIDALVKRGLVSVHRRTTVEAAWSEDWALMPESELPIPELSPDQHRVVDAVGATLGRGFSAHLLHGVTGSGKTEVYLTLLQRVLDRGGVGLVLVPEISLTPQTGGRIMTRFRGQRVAVLHSGLTAAQRNHQWRLVADGDASLIIGARSAVFAPIPDGRLALVIVDEEHDGSYKQDSAPRYHGRDVAIRRAQLAGCPVLLGSATPSLESWHNATQREQFALHRLPQRAPGLRTPHVVVVDFAEERRHRRDRRVHLLGPRLEEALRRVLETPGPDRSVDGADGGMGGGQAILLLNRRGYANYIACPDHRCGWTMSCDHCDAAMVCHVDARVKAGMYLRCHHCQSETRLPPKCPRCGNRTSIFGLGTQRVEEELQRKFAQLNSGETLLRIDADTMARPHAFHDALRRFARGEVRVLLGTQMIAKGLDFPGVRLVGVVNADTAISLPDFRAAERTFQLVSQVAGRCGRGLDAGLAIVQTFQPDLAAIRLAAEGRFEDFATDEIAARASASLPPTTRMARIVIRDRVPEKAEESARRLADGLRAIQRTRSETEPTFAEIRVLGPAPCPIARVADRWRHQIELTAPTASLLQRLLAAARSSGAIVPGERIAVDVDPLNLC